MFARGSEIFILDPEQPVGRGRGFSRQNGWQAIQLPIRAFCVYGCRDKRLRLQTFFRALSALPAGQAAVVSGFLSLHPLRKTVRYVLRFP